MNIRTDALIKQVKDLDEGEVEFVVSTNAEDAHGERMNVDGINTKDFMKNPIVLWAHDAFSLPIAKATKIWKEDNKLMARAQFYMQDDFPRKVYNYIKDGFLNTVSIGGMVDEWGKDGMTIAKMTMKEFSVVPIPANPEAMVANKSLDMSDYQELRKLAYSYARKVINEEGDDQLKSQIDVLSDLTATLKEVYIETDRASAEENIRVVLRSAQAVDQQAEQVIKAIKKKG